MLLSNVQPAINLEESSRYTWQELHCDQLFVINPSALVFMVKLLRAKNVHSEISRTVAHDQTILLTKIMVHAKCIALKDFFFTVK